MSQTARIKLKPEQTAAYEGDGYLVVNDLISSEEIDTFLAHEERRLGEPDLGLLTHTVDSQWKYLATHPNVAGIVAQILGGPPRVVQTMYLPKKAGMEVRGAAFHQDVHHLPNEPNTLMACWVALSDTGYDNGGLCVVPGSHRGPLRSTHASSGDEHHVWTKTHLMRDRNGKEWTEEFVSFEIDDLDHDSLKKLEIPAGAGVFFHGMTIHGSFVNRSATRDRLAFAVHYVKEGSWVLRADVQNTMPVPEDAYHI